MRTLWTALALSLTVAAGLLWAPSFVFAEPNFSEGMWEMKGDVKFEGGGMKINGKTIPMASRPIHYKKCLTKKDMVPHEEGKNTKCTKTEKMSGSSISWTLKCSEPNGMVITSTGSGVFSHTSFEGKARTVMTDAKGEKSVAHTTMKGQRIGACK